MVISAIKLKQIIETYTQNAVRYRDKCVSNNYN